MKYGVLTIVLTMLAMTNVVQAGEEWSEADEAAFAAASQRRVAAHFGDRNIAPAHTWKGVQQSFHEPPAGCREIREKIPGGTAVRVCCGPSCSDNMSHADEDY